MNNTEIRIKMLRLLDQAITLKGNDNNGCPTSGEELEAIMPRVVKAKEWAIANDEMQNVLVYLKSKQTGLGSTKFLYNDMVCFMDGSEQHSFYA